MIHERCNNSTWCSSAKRENFNIFSIFMSLLCYSNYKNINRIAHSKTMLECILDYDEYLDDEYLTRASRSNTGTIKWKTYGKTLRFAKRALGTTNNNALKSEAAFQLARAQHALGQFEDAHRKYEHAVALNPKNVMAQYGLAQIKYGLFQGTDQAQQHDAIRILKMINTDLMPNNVDVLYVVFEREAREF